MVLTQKNNDGNNFVWEYHLTRSFVKNYILNEIRQTLTQHATSHILFWKYVNYAISVTIKNDLFCNFFHDKTLKSVSFFCVEGSVTPTFTTTR